jgi:sucrose-6-phosphate hydrolase SacC (GH32 family)
MLDYGSYYAPKTTASADGSRRIMFGWLTERWCDSGDEYNGGCTQHAPHTLPPIGWDGAQALPRELSFDAAGKLLIKPVQETVTLRTARGATVAKRLRLDAGGAATYLTKGRALELQLNTSMPAVGSCVAMDVLASPSTSERTTILLDGTSKKLSIITVNSSLGPVGGRTPYRSPPLLFLSRLSSGVRGCDDIFIHVFVDHSCIEVFINERIAITARAYPVASDSEEVRLWSDGKDATVDVASWQLALV